MTHGTRARRVLAQADREIAKTGHLLSVATVARLLGVCPETIRLRIRAGKIPVSYTPGGHYRIAAQTCNKLLNDLNKVAKVTGEPLPLSTIL